MLVRSARLGKEDARNRLIAAYQPFIIKTASAVSRRYLQIGLDEEISVALMAFNEAIDCYDLGGKVPFLAFAQIVIKRRLVDFFRRQSRNSREVPFSHLEPDDEGERDYPAVASLYREAESNHANWLESIERREEILRFRRILADYGLDYKILARTTPKHDDTRLRLVEIARAAAAQGALTAQIRKRKALPVAELVQLSGLSRKTIERHRHYLLSLILLLNHDLPHLQVYLQS